MLVLKLLGWLLLAWFLFHFCRGFVGTIRDSRRRRARREAKREAERKRREEEEALEELFGVRPTLKVFWPDR